MTYILIGLALFVVAIFMNKTVSSVILKQFGINFGSGNITQTMSNNKIEKPEEKSKVEYASWIAGIAGALMTLYGLLK